MSAIREILYASDLTSLKQELRTVKRFATKVDSSVSVVHFAYIAGSDAKQAFEKAIRKKELTSVKFTLQRASSEKPLSWHLRKAARKVEADLVALFTSHDQPWLTRLVEGSWSAEASFDTLKPLLVFPK